MRAETALPNSSRTILLNAVSAWISDGLKDEARLERANKRMLATLTQHLDLKVADYIPDEPQNPAQKLESAVVAGYMSIMGMLTSIRECEHYFRRYPFKNRGISRSDYLRNCCEMLFDRVAQLRDRLKISLNAIQKQRPNANVPVGKIIKAFDGPFVRRLS